ncbi:MAG: hypothetical protein HDQ99_14550 [Lachnospiraceae bacterium]|nr:hypothetical protein [Lachnospiraceae bacterium]
MSQQKEPDYVWDGCELYKEELRHVHASAELVAVTKEKAAAEEGKQKRQRLRRKMYLPAVAAAAFAVVVLSFPLWQKAPTKGLETPVQPYLGSAADMPKSGEETVLQQTAVLPVAFLQENAWTEELEGIQVEFVQEDSGYIAAFAGEAGYTVVSSKTEDLETFREDVRLLLQNGGECE